MTVAAELVGSVIVCAQVVVKPHSVWLQNTAVGLEKLSDIFSELLASPTEAAHIFATLRTYHIGILTLARKHSKYKLVALLGEQLLPIAMTDRVGYLQRDLQTLVIYK